MATKWSKVQGLTIWDLGFGISIGLICAAQHVTRNPDPFIATNNQQPVVKENY